MWYVLAPHILCDILHIYNIRHTLSIVLLQNSQAFSSLGNSLQYPVSTTNRFSSLSTQKFTVQRKNHQIHSQLKRQDCCHCKLIIDKISREERSSCILVLLDGAQETIEGSLQLEFQACMNLLQQVYNLVLVKFKITCKILLFYVSHSKV